MTPEDNETAKCFKREEDKEKIIIKVVGVGGGGNNAVSHMYRQGISDVSFVVCNTDRQALDQSPVPNKLMIGSTGLGAGNVPEVARKAAEESAEDIAQLFKDGTKMVFITAGMGGGTGTGAAPVVARIAKELEILTIGIVTIPFLFEGRKKILKALAGAEEMSKYVDALLVINNERLTEIYADLEFMNAFAKADDTLTIAASGISELITDTNSIINIDFEDVKTTLHEGGSAIISIGYGEGEHRVTKAIQDALNSPLLKDRDVVGSQRLLFNIYIDPDAKEPFKMAEANEITEFVSNIGHSVDVIWGAAYDRSLGDKLKITILAAGFSSENNTFDPARVAAEQQAKPANSTTKKTDDVVIITPETTSKEEKEKLDQLYGRQKAEVINMTAETKRYIILSPEEILDEEMLEIFETTPTFTRDIREVEELRNSRRNQSVDSPLDNPNNSNDSKSSSNGGTTIKF